MYEAAGILVVSSNTSPEVCLSVCVLLVYFICTLSSTVYSCDLIYVTKFVIMNYVGALRRF